MTETTAQVLFTIHIDILKMLPRCPIENYTLNLRLGEIVVNREKKCPSVYSYTKCQCLFQNLVLNNYSFLDLDPCNNASCKFYSYCVALSPHTFTCACENSCPSYEEQVCASNGRTFNNICLLKQEICRTRGNYTKYHPGSCSGTCNLNVFMLLNI